MFTCLCPQHVRHHFFFLKYVCTWTEYSEVLDTFLCLTLHLWPSCTPVTPERTRFGALTCWLCGGASCSFGHRKIMAQTRAKLLMSISCGCQVLLVAPLATPVLVTWCQGLPCGPETSWHSLSVSLLLASLSLQNRFANFLTSIPWSRLTPEPW